MLRPKALEFLEGDLGNKNQKVPLGRATMVRQKRAPSLLQNNKQADLFFVCWLMSQCQQRSKSGANRKMLPTVSMSTQT